MTVQDTASELAPDVAGGVAGGRNIAAPSYQYDELDRAIVGQRVLQYRGQVARRMDGKLEEEEFRPLRLMNGLYLQLHAYMLRVAVPYGTLSAPQMRVLAHIARKYDKGYGHITTRQNIQYNWIKLDDAPDILADLASVDMHAIQTSGNCIRNVTSDHYAGAAIDEVEDPRIYAEVIRQWSTFHPEFSYLPRKFKIAVIGTKEDRAAMRLHDIGLRVRRNDAGDAGFEVIVGGGLGRTPFIGPTIRDFLPAENLLSYLEAILRVYNMLGRRDNKYKARIKILVHATGREEFARQVEAEWQAMDRAAVDIPQTELDRIAGFFAPPPFRTLDEISQKTEGLLDPAFIDWAQQNVSLHKQPGYAIVNLSLKTDEQAPGDISADQMDVVADLADKYSFGEIRATHEQNLVLPHVEEADLYKLWQALSANGLATANIGLLSDLIACPGLDYCALANARSIPVGTMITEHFEDIKKQHDVGDLKIKISGCINACGHHHVGHIGILGVDKKGEEFNQITLGGSADEHTSLGDIVGPAFSYDTVAQAVADIIHAYLDLRQPHEQFLETYRRVGLEPFKEKLYDAD